MFLFGQQSLTFIYDKEELNVLTFDRLKPTNVWSFCSMNNYDESKSNHNSISYLNSSAVFMTFSNITSLLYYLIVNSPSK